MNLNEQKEQFSLAYIRAVAAQAGYQITRPEVDNDSVDGTLIADFGRRPRIDFQAKATSRQIVQGDNIHFALKIKNYDDLRAETRTPRILIVVLMPKEKNQWLTQTQEQLCLRHCGYWVSLEGHQEVSSTTSITVHIPLVNMFNVEQLDDLMTKVEKGQSLC